MKLALLLLAFASARVDAQRTTVQVADSSGVGILAHAGLSGDISKLVPVFRRARANTAPAALDQLGDSLVNRVLAVGPRNTDARRYTAAIRAMNVLFAAGRDETGPGQPYAGAYDRLVQIAERSPVLQLRQAALLFLTTTPQRATALLYLKQVAKTSDPAVASAAIAALITDASGGVPGARRISSVESRESLQVLGELSEQHLVRDPVTAYNLANWYAGHRLY
ncbi:MAG TPA: hypothetical protein VN650_02085 [Gemmatimonadaceae bacterium]|nr:hypothetical protein [Gemmatimonadaceae bacterium]